MWLVRFERAYWRWCLGSLDSSFFYFHILDTWQACLVWRSRRGAHVWCVWKEATGEGGRERNCDVYELASNSQA